MAYRHEVALRRLGRQSDSATLALDASGNVQASALYDPYGQVRYSSGTMPGSYGFTGQRADSATGLNYYNARFYDPVAGQFAQADTVAAGGLNRYGYVHGNPETATAPTGHVANCIANLAHHPNSLLGWIGAAGGCLGDLVQGAKGLADGKMAKQGIDLALTQFKRSGTYRFLNKNGVQAVKDLSDWDSTLNRVKSFAGDWRNLAGLGKSPAEMTMKALEDISNDTNLVVHSGPGGGKADLGALRGALGDLGEGAGFKLLGTVSKFAGPVGFALVGITAGLQDYQDHGNWERAVGVGLLHAGLSITGAYGGEILGTLAGGLCGEGAVVCSPGFAALGGAGGALGGDMAAGWLVDQYDNGNIPHAYAAATSAVSNAWNGVTSALGF
jgi:RHS repeat-associated protein